MASSEQELVSHHSEGYSVVSIPKALAKAHPNEIRQTGERIIQALSASDPPNCIVDLTAVDTIGSSLVASIVRIWKAVSRGDGQMVVVASSQGAREVLSVTGLDGIWTIAPTLQAGIHSLGYSKEAKVVKRERRLLVMVSAFSLVNAIAAVMSRMLPQLAEYRQPADVLVYSILGLTVVTSTICLFREHGWRLGLSVIVFLASLGLSGVFIWHNEYRITPESSPDQLIDRAAMSEVGRQPESSIDERANSPPPGAVPSGSSLPFMPPRPSSPIASDQPAGPSIRQPERGSMDDDTPDLKGDEK